jgi:hypothetical protein
VTDSRELISGDAVAGIPSINNKTKTIEKIKKAKGWSKP